MVRIIDCFFSVICIALSDTMERKRVLKDEASRSIPAQFLQVLCPKFICLQQEGLSFKFLEKTKVNSIDFLLESAPGFPCQQLEGKFPIPSTGVFVRWSMGALPS